MTRRTNAKRFFAAIAAASFACALFLNTTALPTAYAQGTKQAPVKALSTNAKSTTVLVYLNGSDLESEAGEATADIAEMLKSGIGTNANVVIETLGTRQWQNYNIASDHTQRYVIKQGKLELVDDSLPQLDTTSPDTLADFINWGTTNYPADRYMLILWDHGAGPVYGFGYDEFQDEGSALTLDEMKQALEANPNVHFDFIGMDCCIMSSLETCVALQPYCDYMILSEDFEPGIGWSYARWMNALEQNPGISTEELAKMIVDDMVSDTAADPENGNATLALIDESAIDNLYTAWLNFAYANKDTLLENNYSQQTEWQTRPEHDRNSKPGNMNGHHGSQGQPMGQPTSNDAWGAWNEQQDWYGNDGWSGMDTWDAYNSWGSQEDWANLWDLWNSDGSSVTMTDYFVTDLKNVATSVENEQSTALQDALNKALVYFNSTSGEEGMSGLSVTLPYGDKDFYNELVKVFSACGIDNDYLAWLEDFTNTSNADSNYNDYGYDTGDDLGYDESYDNNYGFTDYIAA